MIRINLLGTPKSKNKRSAASTVAAMDMGDVGSPAMKAKPVTWSGKNKRRTISAAWMLSISSGRNRLVRSIC